MELAALAFAMLMAAAPAAEPTKGADKATEVAPATVTGDTNVYGIVEGKNVPKTEKVCFKDPVSGSHIPTKRCMNRDQFYEKQRETREYIEKFQREVSIPQ